MSRCPYSKEDRDKDKKGIKRLLNNGTYISAFPLHDVRGCLVSFVDYEDHVTSAVVDWRLSICMQSSYWKRSRNPNCESDRYDLYKHWAQFFCFFKEQPLNLVR